MEINWKSEWQQWLVQDRLQQFNVQRSSYLVGRSGSWNRFRVCPCGQMSKKRGDGFFAFAVDGTQYKCHRCDNSQVRGTEFYTGRRDLWDDEKKRLKGQEVSSPAQEKVIVVASSAKSNEEYKAKNREWARKIWDNAKDANTHGDKVVLKYLYARGLWSDGLQLPDTLRVGIFKGVLAMVAKITDTEGNFLAVHVTGLSQDGHKKELDASGLQRKIIGSFAGGGVFVSFANHSADRIVFGEGIESTTNAARYFAAQGFALLSASNMKNFTVPNRWMGKKLIIAQDTDESGTGARAANAFRQRVMLQTNNRTNICVAAAPMVGNNVDFADITF